MQVLSEGGFYSNSLGFWNSAKILAKTHVQPGL